MNFNKSIIVFVLILIVIFALPWKNFNWGKVSLNQLETVTVTGEARTTQKNQIASFTAGVNIIKDKKDDAVDEANKKIKELIDSVKAFGINEADIKTQNMSVYQQQDIEQKGTNKWVVNNSVEITLRDITKANELTDLLNKSGANNVYGPNYRLDDTSSIEKTLYDGAIKDAKDKAEIMAKASGRKLGKVVGITEGSGGSGIVPVYKLAADSMGGGSVSEPGSETVSKSLTVVFGLE